MAYIIFILHLGLRYPQSPHHTSLLYLVFYLGYLYNVLFIFMSPCFYLLWELSMLPYICSRVYSVMLMGSCTVPLSNISGACPMPILISVSACNDSVVAACLNDGHAYSQCVLPKWHSIPNVVHYLWPGAIGDTDIVHIDASIWNDLSSAVFTFAMLPSKWVKAFKMMKEQNTHVIATRCYDKSLD